MRLVLPWTLETGFKTLDADGALSVGPSTWHPAIGRSPGPGGRTFRVVDRDSGFVHSPIMDVPMGLCAGIDAGPAICGYFRSIARYRKNMFPELAMDRRTNYSHSAPSFEGS